MCSGRLKSKNGPDDQSKSLHSSKWCIKQTQAKHKTSSATVLHMQGWVNSSGGRCLFVDLTYSPNSLPLIAADTRLHMTQTPHACRDAWTRTAQEAAGLFVDFTFSPDSLPHSYRHKTAHNSNPTHTQGCMNSSGGSWPFHGLHLQPWQPPLTAADLRLCTRLKIVCKRESPAKRWVNSSGGSWPFRGLHLQPWQPPLIDRHTTVHTTQNTQLKTEYKCDSAAPSNERISCSDVYGWQADKSVHMVQIL